MSHAKLVYDNKAVCQSRVVDDYDRVVNLDEKGAEHVTYEKVDYSKIQQSLGDFMKWSLKSLLDAGIDPKFGIHTGFNTRLEGEMVVSSAAARVVSIVESENKKSE